MKSRIICLLALIVFAACENDNENKVNKATLQVRLTDAPAKYEEVLINIQEVWVRAANSDSAKGWQMTEKINKGSYNLLDLTNGKDTVLAETLLSADTLTQIRLVLGDGNMVKTNGKYYDLNTPSAQQSGLTINIHAALKEGITHTLWLDFDGHRSIVEKGHGSYALKPVIRAYTQATSGAIIGTVAPKEARPCVMAVSERNDTSGTYTDTINGSFLIKGLAAGNYTVILEPLVDYAPRQLNNVKVVEGQTTMVGSIVFVNEF
ncbi:MAG: DUF4382 domain-containing protein [Bacteroidales bacterium]|nr:DUF4382 domain-containing protein [Bacteroidales bacterium]